MLYYQSTRDGSTVYTSHNGMDATLVLSLLEELGHTNVQSLSEEDYLVAIAAN